MAKDVLPCPDPHPSSPTSLRSACHPVCFVCAPNNPLGLRLAFHLLPNDSLACRFSFAQHWEGYSGLVHGGILAAALDGAMTNWLLAHGHAAVTAELKVRYRHPIAVNRPAFIVARLVEISGPVYLMTAELRQAGRRAVTATAKFMLNASSAKITKAPS